MSKRISAQYRFCLNCKNILEEKHFFTFKGEDTDCICKECRLKDKSDRTPSDYYSLFELYDIPFIRNKWEELVDRQIKACVIENKPYTSIFGKYLATMKLKSYKHFRWEDSKTLNLIWIERKDKSNE